MRIAATVAPFRQIRFPVRPARVPHGSAFRLCSVFLTLPFVFSLIAAGQNPSNGVGPLRPSAALNSLQTNAATRPVVPAADSDRVDETAHRVRLLEERISARDDSKYLNILIPLLVAGIGAFAVYWSARLGRSGQERAADAAAAAAKQAAESNAALARNSALETARLAKTGVVFKHAEQMMEFKLKQIQEFYAPIYASLKQSLGLYDKMLDQLVHDEPGRYRRSSNPQGTDFRWEVLDQDGTWKGFRLVDQLPAIKSNPRALALADANLKLGKTMAKIIATRAGYATEDSIELLGEYMAHHAILTAIRNGPETEAFEAGRHKIGAFPYGLDDLIGKRYHELNKAIEQYGQAYDRALELLSDQNT